MQVPPGFEYHSMELGCFLRVTRRPLWVYCAVCGLGFLFGCFVSVLLGLFIVLLFLCGTYFCVSAYVG